MRNHSNRAVEIVKVELIYLLNEIEKEKQRKEKSNMKVKIYQIDPERDSNAVAFDSYDHLEKLQGSFAIESSIYNKVYEGTIPPESDLEDAYRIFNIEKPENYEGRSLSVSDVIEVIESENVKPGFYYCDSIGFKEIEFDPAVTGELQNRKITVVKVEPGKEAYITEVGTGLEDLQNAVDGCIEAYYPFEEEVCIVCNDEGKLNGSAPCRAIYDKDGEIADIIFGKFIICDCSGDGFGSLSEEQQKRYLEKYRMPERMVRKNGNIGVEKINEKVSCRSER